MTIGPNKHDIDSIQFVLFTEVIILTRKSAFGSAFQNKQARKVLCAVSVPQTKTLGHFLERSRTKMTTNTSHADHAVRIWSENSKNKFFSIPSNSVTSMTVIQPHVNVHSDKPVILAAGALEEL